MILWHNPINTIYGGWGSGEVYKRGTDRNIQAVSILEGIKNKKDKFIYIENTIGYEIGIPGLSKNKDLTDENIKEFSTKQDGAQRSVAILTISRRSGEGYDRPQDSSSSSTKLLKTEIDNINH